MKIKLSNVKVAKIIDDKTKMLTISISSNHYNNFCEILIKNNWHYKYYNHTTGHFKFVIYKHQYNYCITTQHIIGILRKHGYFT